MHYTPQFKKNLNVLLWNKQLEFFKCHLTPETFKYAYRSEFSLYKYRWRSVFYFHRSFVSYMYVYITCTIYKFTHMDCINYSLKTTCIFCKFLYIIAVCKYFSKLWCEIFCKLIFLFCFKATQYIHVLCFTKSPTLPPL